MNNAVSGRARSGLSSACCKPDRLCYDEKMDTPPLQVLQQLLNRQAAGHKYDFGHVLVVGGSPGMVGAPLLAARAALRTGAGLVTIAAAEPVIDKLEKRVEEVMTLRLDNVTEPALRTLTDFIDTRRVGVLAIGPGVDRDHAPLVRALLTSVRLPTVLDAGGLGAYNDDLPALQAAGGHNPYIILTPHAGEFARLTGSALPQDSAAIKQLVKDTAAASGTTIVLKGHRSLVAGGGRFYVNATGNPGLATAGTGDVLTGIIAGLAAQGCPAFEAAAAGAYLHGLAGDLAAAAKTQPGLIASDVIECLPTALTRISTAEPDTQA